MTVDPEDPEGPAAPVGRGARSVLDDPTLVLNRSWVPVHVTTVRRALSMTFSEVARPICEDSLQVHDFASWWDSTDAERHRTLLTTGGPLRAPEIILSQQYDRVPVFRAPFSRQGLFRRDDYSCQYCGVRPGPSKLTIDHVVPRSRGGPTSWTNCVVACRRCNSAKGDRDLHKSGLQLRTPPRIPSWNPGLQFQSPHSLDSWQQFLPKSERRTGA